MIEGAVAIVSLIALNRRSLRAIHQSQLVRCVIALPQFFFRPESVWSWAVIVVLVQPDTIVVSENSRAGKTCFMFCKSVNWQSQVRLMLALVYLSLAESLYRTTHLRSRSMKLLNNTKSVRSILLSS